MSNAGFHWDEYIAGANEQVPALSGTLPWHVDASAIVRSVLPTLGAGYSIQGECAIHESAVVEQGVILKGPMILGPGCFVGAHAYLRGGVYLVGNNSIGPGCELKSCILFPRTALAHFNFVGDSVIGSDVNFEAGSIVANHYNERDDKQVHVLIDGKTVATGVTKFGAVAGDHSRVGANAVLSPGTILSKRSVVGRLELVKQTG